MLSLGTMVATRSNDHHIGGVEGNHSEGLASGWVAGVTRWADGEDSADGGEAASPPLAPSLSSAASALFAIST